MSDDEEHRFTDYVKSFCWRELSALLKEVGSKRAEVLVTSLLDQEKHATALIVCARSSSDHHHNHNQSSTTSETTPRENERGEGGDDAGAEESPAGLLETCQVLVNNGADLNHRDRSGKTALHWAVASDKPQLTALLLSMGSDVGSTDNVGHTALHTAICAGNQACVGLLLQHDRQVLDEEDAHGTPPLTLAVQQGHSAICRQLLEAGADVTAQEVQTLRTPLHYALYLKHLDIFTLLLSYKPNLRVVDHRGTTVVHRCCAVQEPDYLAHVLHSSCEHVADVINMEDNEGATPVIIACQNDNVRSVQLLLDEGANVNTKDMHGRTALHHCVENSDTTCAELLLKTDPSLLSATDGEGLTPLHMAVIAGNVSLIRLLLKRGASLQCRDQEEHTVAHWATVCGHSTVLDVLLEYGADLSVADKHQACPIHYAAQMTKKVKEAEGVGAEEESGGDTSESEVSGSEASSPGNTRLLRKLLANKVSPDVRDKDERTPVIWAASAGNAEACRVLVEAGADVNSADKDGLSALHCAASRGHADCLRMLVDTCKACVDPVDKNQCTPLFYATTLGHQECVNVLLDIGASPNHTDTRGRTTAHCAAVKGSRDSLEVLGKKGVDLWQPTAKGDYPIHEAAQAGHVEVIEYLLRVRGNPEAIDTANRDGRTCLHIAALTNNLWLAKFLLDHSADVNAIMRNKGKNFTPYDAAVAKGNKEAADYLQSRGGRKASAVRPSSTKRRRSSSGRDRPTSGKDRPASGKDKPASSKERPDRSKERKSSSKERPASGKDRPASGKERPTSGKEKISSSEERPHSGKARPASGIERPESSKERKSSAKERSSSSGEERPASGKEKPAGGKDRPASSKDRPASSKDRPASSKDRPASRKERPASSKERPASGKAVAETQKRDAEEEDKPEAVTTKEQKERPRSSSPKKTKERSSSAKSPDSRSRSPTKAADEAEKGNESKENEKNKKQVGSADEADGSTKERKLKVVILNINGDSSPTKDEKKKSRSGSPDKQIEDKDQDKHSRKRKQSPHKEQTRTHKENKDTSEKARKKREGHKEESKEEKASTQKSQGKSGSSSKSASSANHSKNTATKTKSSQQKQDTKQQQQRNLKQASKKKHRSRSHSSHSSRSSSSSSNRSRSSSRHSKSSSSRSRSRSSSTSSMGSGSSKKNSRDGDGLNLFSDNENVTDHEDDHGVTGGSKMTPDNNKAGSGEAQASGRSGGDGVDNRHHQHDEAGGVREHKKRPRSSRLIADVQDSVRRYEQERKSIRELRQLRRAQIYSGHTRNLALFHSMLMSCGARQTAPTWDQMLQEQPKSRCPEQHRSKTNGKADSKEDINKNGTDKNHVESDKECHAGTRTTHTARRRRVVVSAPTKRNNYEEPFRCDSPGHSPSRRNRPYDCGDPAMYREFQRQRTGEMHRLLLKAYKPALPADLFTHEGKALLERSSSPSASSKASRPSTTKSHLTRPVQVRHGSFNSGHSGPSGMSNAQYRAVQRSYTIMTPLGTRRVKPDNVHHTFQRQHTHNGHPIKEHNEEHRHKGASSAERSHNHS